MKKHRKDWSEWAKKRAADHRRERETREAIAKAIKELADSLFAHPSPLLHILRNDQPVYGGKKMQIPLQYREKQ